MLLVLPAESRHTFGKITTHSSAIMFYAGRLLGHDRLIAIIFFFVERRKLLHHVSSSPSADDLRSTFEIRRGNFRVLESANVELNLASCAQFFLLLSSQQQCIFRTKGE